MVTHIYSIYLSKLFPIFSFKVMSHSQKVHTTHIIHRPIGRIRTLSFPPRGGAIPICSGSSRY